MNSIGAILTPRTFLSLYTFQMFVDSKMAATNSKHALIPSGVMMIPKEADAHRHYRGFLWAARQLCKRRKSSTGAMEEPQQLRPPAVVVAAA